jgi:hypothetical protein
MSLSRIQQQFMQHFGMLLHQIYARGYGCTGGHLYRCQDCPVGTKNSNHKIRLAVDLQLFKDGKYLTDPEEYRQFAQYWEALHPDNRSGIRYNDANHFERLDHVWRDGAEEKI